LFRKQKLAENLESNRTEKVQGGLIFSRTSRN